jgi:hypothetical protein
MSEKSRRRGRWRAAGGYCRREDEEEIEKSPNYSAFSIHFVLIF